MCMYVCVWTPPDLATTRFTRQEHTTHFDGRCVCAEEQHRRASCKHSYQNTCVNHERNKIELHDINTPLTERPTHNKGSLHWMHATPQVEACAGDEREEGWIGQ